MNQKHFSVAGKVVIVAGGRTGVGAGIVRGFAANAAVLITWRKAENRERVRDQLCKEGGACGFRICDIRDPGAASEVCAGVDANP